MKFKILTFALILALIMAGLGQVKPVSASGWGTKFVTSITYQNVGTGSSTVQIDFYPAGSGTPITISRPDIARFAGNSVYIGGLGLSGFSQGSAIMSSSQPLVATLVQVPPTGSLVKVRPLSSGFSGGAASVMMPTILKNASDATTIFTVQNVDTDNADITVSFKALTGNNFEKSVTNLPVGSSAYFDMSTYTEAGTAFNGSATITAKKTGTATDGAIVATSLELKHSVDAAYAFEGVTSSANTIYMPSSACKVEQNPPNGKNYSSYYAIQNTDPSVPANVTITYRTVINSTTIKTTTDSFTIQPGLKASKDGCGNPADQNPPNSLGSATITSTGGKIVAMGKLVGNGLTTAYVGFSSGASKYALPYVRYSNLHWSDGTQQRGFIAIQNVGGADLAAGTVTVKYYDIGGNLVGTHTLGALAAKAKLSSNATMATPTNAGTCGTCLTEFGYNGGTGGGVIVEGPAGSQLAVIVRIQTYVPATLESASEDYNGIPIQ